MEVRVYSPTAILGYGFPRESLERAVREGFDVIGVDAGSTDPGPYYLGSGDVLVPDPAVERDLRLLVEAALEQGVPLLIGSAGGAGARPHVEATLRVLERVAGRLGRRLGVGVIYTDVDREALADMLREGLVGVPADSWPGLGQLSVDAVLSSTHIVAQAGFEVMVDAVRAGYDVVLAGRIVDVAPFAALPLAWGGDPGLALHMAKILECGALAAEPGSGSDGMMGVLRRGEFLVYPVNPARRATVASVAEHALYERRDPWREYLPGGYVDLSRVEYEEGEGGVVVRGARWVPARERMVKLEGAGPVGHRVLVFAAARDPGFIGVLGEALDAALARARDSLGGGGWRVHVRVYGVNGVLGDYEPEPAPGREVALLVEVVAGTQEEAEAVASLVRSSLLHYGWRGRKTTSGNLAFPLSPSDVYAGVAYEWRVWHLIPERDPWEHASLVEVSLGA